MRNLLAFEYRKLFRQISFYVCLGAAVLLSFLAVYTVRSMAELLLRDMPPGADLSLWMGAANLSGKGQMLSALAGENVALVVGIFTALFICADYSGKTAKNIIGRGYTREGWLGARLAAVGSSCLIMSLAALGTAFISGTLFWEAGKALSLKETGLLLLQLFLMLAYTALFVFISTAVRSSGGAIALNVLVPILVSLILTIVDLTAFEGKETTVKYWLSSCLATASDPASSGGDLIRCWLLGGAYLVVFTGLSFWITRKRDV